ncbi:MAG: FAD-dependent oxidoreductase [Proteobacteria bacterium]|nr:FAD-dependent oxidoreductase [Pseudomonadota bacterium]
MALEYDAVVVGAGPGGASAARELVRAGRKVVMLEYGPDGGRIGSHLSLINKIDLKNALPLGHEVMVRGLATGGSSLIYCGTATKPAAFIRERTGIDLDPLADQFIEELGVAPLPDSLVGESALRIMESAQRLGLEWQLLPKFIDPSKCVPHCGECMLGCRREAKFTARRFVNEARTMGLTLRPKTRVDRVITEGGKAVGVFGLGPDGPVEVRAEKVILAAGGLGTPIILKRSGIDEAGQGFFSDPLVFTYGLLEDVDRGSIYDIPMTAGTWQFHEKEGVMMTDLAEPWMLLMASMGTSWPPRVDQWPRMRRTVGIMTKVKDPVSGTIDARGRLRKDLEPEVRWRLAFGDRQARAILRQAGVREPSLFTSPVKAAHPGGSAPIGRVVDRNLETDIKNCFVADASVVPDELGTPVVLLALCIGRYAAQTMLANWN